MSACSPCWKAALTILLVLACACTSSLPTQPRRDNPFDPDLAEQPVILTVEQAGDSVVLTWDPITDDRIHGLRLYEAVRPPDFVVVRDCPLMSTRLALPLTQDRFGRQLSYVMTVLGTNSQESVLRPEWASILRTPPLLVSLNSGTLFTNVGDFDAQVRCDGALAMKACVGQDSSTVSWGEYSESFPVVLPTSGGWIPLDVFFLLPGNSLQAVHDTIAYDASCALQSIQFIGLGEADEPFGYGESFRIEIQLANDSLGAETGAQLSCNWPGVFSNLACVDDGNGLYHLDYAITDFPMEVSLQLEVTGLDRAGNSLHAQVLAPSAAWDNSCEIHNINWLGLNGSTEPMHADDMIRFTVQLADDNLGPETGAQVILTWAGVMDAMALQDQGGGRYSLDLTFGNFVSNPGTTLQVTVTDRAGRMAQGQSTAPQLAQDQSCVVQSFTWIPLHGATEPLHFGDRLRIRAELTSDAWGVEIGAMVIASWDNIFDNFQLTDLGDGNYESELTLVPFATPIGSIMELTVTDRAGITIQTQVDAPLIDQFSLFVNVTSGSFNMGESGVSTPIHVVTLNRDFMISRTEVTNQEYLSALQWAYNNGLVGVSGNNVQAYGQVLLNMNNSSCAISFANGLFSLESVHGGDYNGQSSARHPVTNVSWYGAASYCDWISLQMGLFPFYSGNWNPSATHSPYEAVGWRLPTEAEWEYAAQYSDDRSFPWGNVEPSASRANYNNNVGGTCPVGSYSAGNSILGLQDVAGNVLEWVNDWSENYSNSTVTNPFGPEVGFNRIYRGGGWSSNAFSLHCSTRNYTTPTLMFGGLGFRIAKMH